MAAVNRQRNLEGTPSMSPSAPGTAPSPYLCAPLGEPQAAQQAAWHFFLESSKFPCSSCDSTNSIPSKSCPSKTDTWPDVPSLPPVSRPPVYPQSLDLRCEPDTSPLVTSRAQGKSQTRMGWETLVSLHLAVRPYVQSLLV